jgi:hypothetical protein
MLLGVFGNALMKPVVVPAENQENILLFLSHREGDARECGRSFPRIAITLAGQAMRIVGRLLVRGEPLQALREIERFPV